MSTTVEPPEHVSIDDDGAIISTWFYGKQGADDSWRIMTLWQPGEGFHVFTTRTMASTRGMRPPCEAVEGEAAGPFLAKVLAEMTAQKLADTQADAANTSSNDAESRALAAIAADSNEWEYSDE